MVISIGRDIPLLGTLAFGIIDRGTNLLQVRPTSVCNLSCSFCSVDSGPKSTWHKTTFEVDRAYLVEETEKIVKFKDCSVEINIDSVGEPFCYPELEALVKDLRKIANVQKISIQTNGTMWKDLDIDCINVSLHAIEPKLARNLMGTVAYDVERVKKFIQKYRNIGKEVRVCPVYIPGVNDAEIPKIIEFAKEFGCSVGIQKYEIYSHSRRIPKVKAQNWWQFSKKLREWEKQYNITLVLTARDVGIVKAKRVPEVFRKGEKVRVLVKLPGWYKTQMIGMSRNRCISIENCTKKPGDLVPVTILETKNNLYLAE